MTAAALDPDPHGTPAAPAATAGTTPQPVVLISGISGSGKSVAINALEDAGYFCVDNLPPELLPELIRLEGRNPHRRLAIAADVRTAAEPFGESELALWQRTLASFQPRD